MGDDLVARCMIPLMHQVVKLMHQSIDGAWTHSYHACDIRSAPLSRRAFTLIPGAR